MTTVTPRQEGMDIRIPTPWHRFAVRKQLRFADYPGRSPEWLVSLADRYCARVKRAFCVATGGQALKMQGTHIAPIHFGQCEHGGWLVLAHYDQTRHGRITRLHRLYQGEKVAELVSQAQAWRLSLGVEGGHCLKGRPPLVRVSSRPMDYFQGQRLPIGITAREMSYLPGFYSVSVNRRGRTLRTATATPAEQVLTIVAEMVKLRIEDEECV